MVFCNINRLSISLWEVCLPEEYVICKTHPPHACCTSWTARTWQNPSQETLETLLQKSRKLRKLVRKHIKKNVPRSSRCIFSRERKKLLSSRVIFLPQPTKKTKRLVVDSRRRRKRMASSQTSVFHFKSSKKYEMGKLPCSTCSFSMSYTA